jgi:hypothetical protein
MTKKLVWTLVGLTLVLFFGFAWAPYIIKVQAERRYPGVHVGDVAIRWGYLSFRSVTVKRKNVEGSLPEVTVDWDKNVTIHGGSVSVELSDTKDEGESRESTSSIKGEGLAVSVKKGDIKAQLSNVHFDSREVCFKTAHVDYQLGADLSDGCVTRDGRVFTGKKIEVPLALPIDIPRVDRSQKLVLSSVTVEIPDRRVTFEGAEVGPLKVKSLSSLRYADEELRVMLNNVEVNHPWVDPEPVTVKTLGFAFPKSIAKGKGAILVTLGPAKITIEPSINHISGEQSCNEWIEALPEPLPLALQQAKGHFKGSFGFEVVTDPTPRLKLHYDCRYECSAEPIASLKKSTFTYQAYDSKDELFTRTAGPGTKDWVAISELRPSVPKAFITLEDPGFLGHRGIIAQALENSLKDNLKLGRFFRGGSTLSMQLAKNLWLRRYKTIGRKAQEALLTLTLESCLSKDQILELYTNVVEFGPNLYGIGPAAHRYFSKPAQDLETDEGFYLASILPHPRKAIPPESGGLSRVHSLMRVLADRGFISEEMVPVRDGEVDASGWETE